MRLSSRFSRAAALLAVNAFALAVIVIGLELAFGDWFAPYVPPDAAIVDRVARYRQSLYEPPSEITYTRDKFGLRGVQEPVEQVRLVTVGGSTTDQRYISDGETWQDVLRAASHIAVANAGVDGMSSTGHVMAVTEWLHRIPGLRPRYYLHYIGVNDASLSRDAERYNRSGHEGSWFRTLLQRSVLARSAVRLWLRSQGAREVNHGRLGSGADLSWTDAKEVNIDTGDIQRYIEAVYKPNLRRLLALHSERGEIAIFVSQPANPAFVLWKDGRAFVGPQSAGLEHWAAGLGMVNAATGAVCRESDNCQFFDLAAKADFQSGDFYDLVHTTPQGGRKIGKFIADELAALATRASSTIGR